ncbi:MAG TPA: tetratricopeptide repeat protein [Chloroflexota bacterium]
MSGLVGRADALEVLMQLLGQTEARLVTLTGPGGIGKTRLAIEATHRLRRTYAERIAFVDLAAVRDARLVLATIATTLGVADTDGQLVEAIGNWIAQRRTLLVLDNFEHVLDAADDVASLLAASSALQVLVTSRTRLRRPGERELAVQPLRVPSAGTQDLEAESVILFVDRARAARAEFTLTADNARAVADICIRLDGIPLAIELAAARIKILSAEQIADRLADCFRLLTGGGPDRPARHRTLRAALDWSVQTLAAAERALLQRMAVFAGGVRIEAVERVCTAPPVDEAEVLDCLAQLVDRSLVVVVDDGNATRYRLLEPVRQYALEQLRSAGEHAEVRTRHAAWFLELAEQVEAELPGRGQIDGLARLDRDFANLRLAMDWYLEHSAAEPALRLAAALWKFCEVRGHAAEGERWLHAALNLAGSNTAARSKALQGAANLAFVRGDYERSTALHEDNLVVRRALGDQHGAAITLFHLASVARSRGDPRRAIELCHECLAFFRRAGDQRWCANTLNSLGMSLMDQGAFGAAREPLDEALSLYRRLGGTRGIAIALGNLGDLDRFESDYDHAEARLRQGLELFHQLDDAWGSSAALESLALVANARGYAERAARLFGAAEAQRAEAGAALAPADAPVHETALHSLRVQLGVEGLRRAFDRGHALSRSGALAFAQQLGGCEAFIGVGATPGVLVLTEREREVAALVARGLTNRQIADALVFTRHTADKHVTNILGKLELSSRAQLAVWWVAHSGQPAKSS